MPSGGERCVLNVTGRLCNSGSYLGSYCSAGCVEMGGEEGLNGHMLHMLGEHQVGPGKIIHEIELFFSNAVGYVV